MDITRKQLREDLIADLKKNQPSKTNLLSSHITKVIKTHSSGNTYSDLIKYHTSYLDETCSFSERVYHIFYELYETPKCKFCNRNIVKFAKFKYREYCSTKCSRNGTSDKIKQTNLERYGVEWTTQSDQMKEKSKQTCLEKYGVEHSTQSKQMKEKSRQTMLDRYGVEHALQAEVFREKSKQTCLNNFGTEYPAQSKEIQKTLEQNSLKKHGVRRPSQSEIVSSKIADAHHKIGLNRILSSDRFRDHYEPLFSIDNYIGVREQDGKAIYYPFRCRKCDTKFDDDINNGRIPRCPTCYPSNQSMGENEVAEFCQRYFDNIIRNVRIDKIKR